MGQEDVDSWDDSGFSRGVCEYSGETSYIPPRLSTICHQLAILGVAMSCM